LSECLAAPAGYYIPESAATQAIPCPAPPSGATANLSRLANDSILDCFDFTTNTGFAPEDNTTYSSSLPVKLIAPAGMLQSEPVTVTFTDVNSPSTFYSYTTTQYVSWSLARGEIVLDVPMTWVNTQTTFGCQGICNGSNLITSIPTGTYDILVVTEDGANQLVSYSAVNVTMTDTTSLAPMMYLGVIDGSLSTSGLLHVSFGIPEPAAANSIFITLTNHPIIQLSTKLHTFSMTTSSQGMHEIDFKLDGTAATYDALNIASESGDPITPGQWWVTVTYQDSLSNPAASYSWGTPILVIRECAAGTFSVDGVEPCIAVPQGHTTNYPDIMSYSWASGSFDPTPCLAGSYQSLDGFTGSTCTLASAGSFVANPGSSSATQCPVGTYQPGQGAISCLVAQPGNYAMGPSATAQIACVRGTYQPSSGQTQCLPARANFYVATSGSATQTACPVNTISAAGSDSLVDCKPKPCAVRAKSTATAKCLVLAAGKTIPAKAKVKIKVNKAHKAICKVSKSKVKTLKRGVCTVTVTVKPKKGKTVKYVVKLRAV
jgi:hypothetical protein